MVEVLLTAGYEVKIAHSRADFSLANGMRETEGAGCWALFG